MKRNFFLAVVVCGTLNASQGAESDLSKENKSITEAVNNWKAKYVKDADARPNWQNTLLYIGEQTLYNSKATEKHVDYSRQYLHLILQEIRELNQALRAADKKAATERAKQ